MSTLAERLALIRRRIDDACATAGRDPAEVRLLPVSKTKPAADVRALHDLGCRRFAENKAQELGAKAAELAGLSDLRWVFVGHLQTNKVKDIVGVAAEFQALDSDRVARELQKRLTAADSSLDVLIQVNSSAEEQKFGVPVAEAVEFAHRVAEFDRLRVRGLMTLAVHSEDTSRVHDCFARMRDLRDRLADDPDAPGDFAELSMGMSQDFEAAIAHGATTVRIGEALFGPRPRPQG